MRIYTFFTQAVDASMQYPGQYSVVPRRRPAGDYGFVILIGNHPHAVYVKF